MTTTATTDGHLPRRGDALLLAHCDRLARLVAAQEPACERLAAAAGPVLARMLLGALAADYGRPARG